MTKTEIHVRRMSPSVFCRGARLCVESSSVIGRKTAFGISSFGFLSAFGIRHSAFRTQLCVVLLGAAFLCDSLFSAEVIHLSFDEGGGTFAADSALGDATSTPNDSVVFQNSAHFAPGKFGTALELSSSASPFQYALFDSGSLGDMLTNAPGAAFACWLMVPADLWNASTNKDKGDLLFLALPTSSSTTRFNVQIRRSAAIRLLARCNDNDSQTSMQTGPFMYGSDQWVHIACVANYAARSMTIYTNGQPALTQTGITTWGGSPVVCSSLLFTNAAVGMNWPATDEAFIGRLDELRFWNEPLSDAQVAAVFAEAPSTVSAPYITRAQLIPGGLVLGGTNGAPNGAYQVVSSSNLGLPASQWVAGTNGNFDGAGNFNITNPVSPGDIRRYYRLLVSGGAPVAPSIFSSPQSRTVVVGQNAAFAVTALGTAPLAYQWYFNSDFAIAGATSSSFTVTNAQTDDAGNYSVLVTNASGSVTSAPAALTVLVPPAITSQPTNQIVSEGQDTTFNVSATGTAPLSYRWYFNTNTPVANATNSSLSFTNVQSSNSGSYLVVVTNRAGSVTSIVATLTVNVVPAAPSISAQPTNQTVFAGQSATFRATVSGTPPLSYQWYFNNTPLTIGTASTLTLNGVTTNQAGDYSVIVTNNYGAATSVVAQLTVNPAPTNAGPDFAHYGFAGYNFNLTGAGSNAPSVVVSNATQLDAYTDSNTNVIIYVSGTIPISGMSTHVRANKTIIGLGNDATLIGGGLYIYGYSNIIIRNLTIRDSSEDNIGIHYARHIWIDHCTIVNATDGGIDITQQSDNITISWCRFYYEFNSGHNFVNLIAASDSDSGNYRVTFHHNWWGEGCVERMPSVRFGRAHIYNNYYNAPGNDYCVRTRIDAQCLVENNHFENIHNPWEQYITSGTPGLLYATNNAFVNVTWNSQYPGTDSVFTPPYPYNLDPVALIPDMVLTNAGAGKGPFAP